ncbi:MAG: hypothetical protein GF334_07835 [Candidatus Altiarchaeales archaeon]|nr:hypothetical protein [Candidatus Altiarchaeales archaeon]
MKRWLELSSKIISCVLNDKGAIIVIYEEIGGGKENIFHPKVRSIWGAIEKAADDSQPPLTDIILNRVPDAQKGLVQMISAQFNEADNANLRFLIRELDQLGLVIEIRQVGKELSEIDLNSIDKVERLESRWLEAKSRQQRRSPDATDLDEVLWKNLSEASIQPVLTGFDWIDDPIEGLGGFWPGKNYWLVAAYKMGKTSVARNILLTAAKAGTPTTFFAAEGTRTRFVLDCQVMLAVELLLNEGHSFENIRLSSKLIMWMSAQKDWTLSSDEYNALNQARAIWRDLSVRVYDSQDGIKDLTAMQAAIKRDKMDRGTKLFFIDYTQILGLNDKTLFERQSRAAMFVQGVANQEQVIMVALSQQNEESIKGYTGHSTGAKGGGDANAAADGAFTLKMDEDEPILKMSLHLGRDAGKASREHVLHLKSGLVIDRWANRETIRF